MFSQALEELALVTVLVSSACFRAVTRSRLSKMRRLNIMTLIIPPNHSAKIANHSCGFSGWWWWWWCWGQQIKEQTGFCHLHGIHRGDGAIFIHVCFTIYYQDCPKLIKIRGISGYVDSFELNNSLILALLLSTTQANVEYSLRLGWKLTSSTH